MLGGIGREAEAGEGFLCKGIKDIIFCGNRFSQRQWLEENRKKIMETNDNDAFPFNIHSQC